jgi:hypothetical protein
MERARSEKSARLNRNLFKYHHGEVAFNVMVSGMKKITKILKLIGTPSYNTVEEYVHWEME